MKRDFASTVARIEHARETGAEVFVVHYACESLAGVRVEPAAVSAVGVQAVFEESTQVFSVVDRPSDAESYVLSSLFDFVRKHEGALIVHWRMNTSEFGFTPLRNRLFHLTKQEAQEPNGDRLVNLASVIAEGYGDDFADHPMLESLIELNGLDRRFSRSGSDEADLFEKDEHALIRRSLAEKLSHLSALTSRLAAGELETKWHGRRLRFSGAMLDSVAVVQEVAHRLIDVSRQLKRRHDKRDTIALNDEYDYQDMYGSLLRVFFDDVRPEAYAPDYAGGASRVDFRLPTYRIVVELKHPKSFGDKGLGDQLIVDIARYAKMPGVRHLVCIVFDVAGVLENPRGLEADLSEDHDGLSVIVRIIDR